MDSTEEQPDARDAFWAEQYRRMDFTDEQLDYIRSRAGLLVAENPVCRESDTVMRKQFWRFVGHHDPYGQELTCFAEIGRDAVIAKAEAAGYIVLNRHIGRCFREDPGLLQRVAQTVDAGTQQLQPNAQQPDARAEQGDPDAQQPDARAEQGQPDAQQPGPKCQQPGRDAQQGQPDAQQPTPGAEQGQPDAQQPTAKEHRG